VNQEWKVFLEAQGAVFNDAHVAHFGQPEAERRAAQGTTLVALTAHRLLRARGVDAQAFLNGQLTNDLRDLDESRSMLAGYCTAQGRLAAIVRVFRRGEDYLLALPMELAEAVFRRLRLFVLRAKVTFDLADAEFACLGIAGPDAAGRLAEALGSVPEGRESCLTRDGVTALSLPAPVARYAIVAPIPAAQELWHRLKDRARPCGTALWDWLDIRAGIPAVYAQTSETFIPQTVNLELVGGVSFTKGCYPGQEIVARVQYLGKLKQRMTRAYVAAPCPAPGTPIYRVARAEQSAGAVVRAAPNPTGGCELLVVAPITSGTIADDLRLGSPTGEKLGLEPLPYPLPEFNGAGM